ncbi:MAG: Xaa-Pro peptidase family protein [Candidatus Latescibacterota bacterium]|jgi:Xaa-Pro aminopeptidase
MDFDLGEADALLVVGDSERLADLFYVTGFRAPDPFVFLWTRRERLLVLSDLELDRGRAQARVDRVVASSVYERRLRQQGVESPQQHEVLVALAQDLGLKHLLVPAGFPLGLAESLRGAGLVLTVAATPLFPDRQHKTAAEVEAIRQALRTAEVGMAAALDLLRQSEVKGEVLHLNGEVLTSERVRRAIHRQLLEGDCTATGTIVAGGDQGCDPHQEGHGPLRPGQPIIIDIFPRSSTTGYFGDLTRTVVKGEAPAAVRALFQTVQRGQRTALDQIRAGVSGPLVHQAVLDLFTAAGYPTGERDGHMEGFFHGTGHGLGLEIHEPPRIGTRGQALTAGQVVTVEPGLYYPGVGGVRLEDVVVVRPDGCENLTTFPVFLEL